MLITKQIHVVLKVHGEVDPDFALVPLTKSLVKDITAHTGDLQTLEAESWNGWPVFFETPGGLEELLVQVTEEGYEVVRGRPDVHWRHFKRTDRIRLIVRQDNTKWEVCWKAVRRASEFETATIPVSAIAAVFNPYLKPGSEPFATLPDGTPLYPAYHPLRRGERFRRALRMWNGSTGEWVGVTLDGQLYRQSQYWGGEGPRPDRWQQFTLG